MLKFILIAILILNVFGHNSYPSLFGMDDSERSPLDDPLANLKAYEQRFQEQVKERDNFYKNALRSNDNSHGYSPYHGSPQAQGPQSVNNFRQMMQPPRHNIYSPMEHRPRDSYADNPMEHRPRDSYDANPMNFIGGIYNRAPSDDQNFIIGQSDSTTDNWLEKKAMYDEFDEVEDRISRADKWDEFKEFATKLKEAAENNPKRDPLNDLREILEWTRNLDKPKPPQFPKKFLNPQQDDVAKSMPSPGMAGYWGEDETDAVSSELKKLSPKEVKEKALRLLQEVDKMEKQNPPEQPVPEPITIPPTPPPERTTQNLFYSFLPKEDDFKAPIRWVSLTSNDTRDGLAKVTDPRTGKNRQYVVNGTVLVPVIDYSVERLGLTTSAPLILTTASSSLRTVVRSVDLKRIDETDWLVFETALDVRERDDQCIGDGCQARCHQIGCDSMCKGDTCATGCVGGSCSAHCKGPGCLSMCIGTGCTSSCDGMSCEARYDPSLAESYLRIERCYHASLQKFFPVKCRGNGCEAKCGSFSCRFVTNGQTRYGGGAWEEHYPQYRYNRPEDNEYY